MSGSATTWQASARVQIFFGQVRHARLAPVLHAFAYPAFFVRIPIHELGPALSSTRLFGIDRPAPLAFYGVDHGDGQSPPLQWIRQQLRDAGLPDEGAVWLDTFPRVFGYAFKPVSFWHCETSRASASPFSRKSTTPLGSATATCCMRRAHRCAMAAN